jgi:hypothetical protein
MWTQAPLGQGVVMQTMPSSIQVHEFAWSARQAVVSACPVQGSATVASAGPPPILVGVVPLEPSPLTLTLPVPHAQSQGGHGAPAGQAGQAQVQVPLPPVPPQEPPEQSHAQGGHVSPGAQA